MLSIRHKVVFVGNPEAGKTSLMNKIVNNEFKEVYDQTIGVDFYTKTVNYKENIFKLQLWDSAGQEKYKALIPSYVRGASLIFVIYDVSNDKSFCAVSSWINFIKENMEAESTRLILVGNKIDWTREVKTAKADDWAKKEKMLFFETSAKTGEGISEMFYGAIAEINFFDDIKKINNNIVQEWIEQNAGEDKTHKNSLLEPSAYNSKLNIKDTGGNQKVDTGRKDKVKDKEENKKNAIVNAIKIIPIYCNQLWLCVIQGRCHRCYRLIKAK